MKIIVAIIRSIDRDDIVSALHQLEDFPGAFESKVRYIPRGMHQTDDQLKEEIPFEEEELIRIEIFSNDQQVDSISRQIRKVNEGDTFISIQSIEFP